MNRGIRLSIAVSVIWIFCAFPLSGRLDDEFGYGFKNQIFSYFFVSLPVWLFWGWRLVFHQMVHRRILWGCGALALLGSVYVGEELVYLPSLMLIVLMALVFSQAEKNEGVTSLVRWSNIACGGLLAFGIGHQVIDSMKLRKKDESKIRHDLQVGNDLSDSPKPSERLAEPEIASTMEYSVAQIESAPEFSVLAKEFNSKTRAQQDIMRRATLNTVAKGSFWVHDVEPTSDESLFMVSGRLILSAEVSIDRQLLVEKKTALSIKKGGGLTVVGAVHDWAPIAEGKTMYHPVPRDVRIFAIERYSEHHYPVGWVSIYQRTYDETSEVRVDGKAIQELRAPIISIQEISLRGFNHPPILFLLSDGGTACAGEFRFLRKESGKFEVSKAFGTCSDKLKAEQMSPNEIQISLPEGKGIKRFLYSDGQVTYM